MIIAISGKIGSGKDTVGGIIQHLTRGAGWMDTQLFLEIIKQTGKVPVDTGTQSPWEIRKFADKLKEIVSLLTGIPRADLEKEEVKNSLLGEEWGFHTLKKVGGKFLGVNMANRFDTKEQAENFRINDTIRPNEWEYYYHIPTVRWLLQNIGTEAMRNHVHSNIWVNALFADYKPLMSASFGTIDFSKGGEYKELIPDTPIEHRAWVITDMRFPNEMEAVEKRNGITVRIRRTQYFRDQDLANPEYMAKHNHPSETSLDKAEFDYIIDNDGTIEELIEKVREVLTKESII